jgi:hypothetical protein
MGIEPMTPRWQRRALPLRHHSWGGSLHRPDVADVYGACPRHRHHWSEGSLSMDLANRPIQTKNRRPLTLAAGPLFASRRWTAPVSFPSPSAFSGKGERMAQRSEHQTFTDIRAGDVWRELRMIETVERSVIDRQPECSAHFAWMPRNSVSLSWWADGQPARSLIELAPLKSFAKLA